jgi:hypothetical protein
VTAHGIPIGPLQFDRLEAAPAAKCLSEDKGKMSKAIEEVLIADQTSKLMRREDAAEGTTAFHFERPPGFSFRAGQCADVTLTDPVETDAKGNTRTFSIASPPFADELVFITRMRNTAFKRSLKKVPLAAEVKIGPATGSFTLHKNLTRPAILSLQVESESHHFLASCNRPTETGCCKSYTCSIPIGGPKTRLSWTL